MKSIRFVVLFLRFTLIKFDILVLGLVRSWTVIFSWKYLRILLFILLDLYCCIVLTFKSFEICNIRLKIGLELLSLYTRISKCWCFDPVYTISWNALFSIKSLLFVNSRKVREWMACVFCTVRLNVYL